MKRLMPEHSRRQLPISAKAVWITSSHPDGDHIALQVDEQALVLRVSTGEIVWRPERAILLAWAANGTEAVTVSAHTGGDSDLTVDCWVWPARRIRSTWPFYTPGGCHDLVISPNAKLGAVTWLEQDCAGFHLVRLDGPSGQECQPEHGDYEFSEGNLLVGPVFSPDGRLLVATCTYRRWWAPEGDPETPSPGGEFPVGQLVTFDARTFRCTETPISTRVAKGWLPENAGEDILAEMMSEPVFVGVGECEVKLPTGETRRLDCATAAKPAWSSGLPGENASPE